VCPRGMHGHGGGWGGGRRGFGPPFGGPFRGPGEGRRRRGDVRAAILALLKDRPMHGYEMIQELEARTSGAWRPSAGSIYPTLQLLEDEGLVVGHESEGRRRYELTDAGREQAERQERPPWEAMTEGDAAAGGLRDAGFQLGAAVMHAARTASREQVAEVRDVLVDARRRIYAILGDGGGSGGAGGGGES
jgi:DNA-binding PadR family transcriptional regulator